MLVDLSTISADERVSDKAKSSAQNTTFNFIKVFGSLPAAWAGVGRCQPACDGTERKACMYK